MKTLLCMLLLLATAMTAIPAANADPGNGHSGFGLCTAWNNNGNGRDNGNAENSTAFQHLQQEAEDQGHDSVEEYCATVPRPGGGNGGGPGDRPRGPPA